MARSIQWTPEMVKALILHIYWMFSDHPKKREFVIKKKLPRRSVSITSNLLGTSVPHLSAIKNGTRPAGKLTASRLTTLAIRSNFLWGGQPVTTASNIKNRLGILRKKRGLTP